MKTNRIFISALLLAFLGLSSCDNYLDPEPHDRYSEMIAWKSLENTKLYLNSFYKNLREYGSNGVLVFEGRLTDGLTDLVKYGSNAPGEGNPNIIAYEPTKITPDQNSLGIWADAYNKIRRINEFLEGLEQYGSFDATTTAQLQAQARFVRAYLYHLLTLRHGSVVLLDKTTTNPANPRSTEAECWDFIEKDLDFAIENLPESWSAADEGRITKGAALAMKSRVMLYAKRWDKAASAAGAVINMAKQGQYALASTYAGAFKSRSEGNKESILEFYYQRPNLVHNWDYDLAPGGDNPGYGAKATPTQNLVEEYETATGEVVDWTPWHNGPTTQTPPYAQLEPRFHATVLYNQATWKGRKIEPFAGGRDGYFDYGYEAYPSGKTTTGYFIRKGLDESNTELALNRSEQSIVEIRYAEVLLNYAEACYMMGGKESEANDAIREIRQRVGLPYTNLSGESLFRKIRKERKIELALEGHRYWDLRRWKLAHTELNKIRSKGMKVTKQSDGTFLYQVIDVDGRDRLFLERLYNFPIPSAEIANNTALTQITPW